MEEQTQQQTADQQAEGQQVGGEQTTATQSVKTFTQEDVNGIAAKEAKKAQEKLLKQLGIQDFESAKDGLTKFREWQESQKTEQEKANEKLTSYENQVKESQDIIFSLKAENAAIKAGITDEKNLNAVITLAKTKVTDEVDIAQAITLVVEEFPHFKTAQPQEEQNPHFTSGQHQRKTDTSDAFVRALLGK
ncbi:hypothetical protein [Ectobacillus antri]|jgi:hypothetical protein|uniref:hypothetical protein n=1 Tax=Ectobacillus antri TaxID=2486280 RepID=UPI001FE3AA6A|nr:hypothetical protein [Ectobacillus antri]